MKKFQKTLFELIVQTRATHIIHCTIFSIFCLLYKGYKSQKMFGYGQLVIGQVGLLCLMEKAKRDAQNKQ